MSSFGDAYKASRERLCALIASLDESELSKRVPACPDWTIKELLAHVTGVAEDTAAGNVAEAGQPQWTEAQIAARRGASVEDLIMAWAEVSGRIEPMLDDVHPAMAGLLVSDLVTHEHDAFQAAVREGSRDSAGVGLALDSYARRFGRRIKDAGLPALRMDADSESWTLGNGDATNEVSGDRFELLRGLSGRRTRDEIAGLEWSGDAAPYLPLFSGYGEPKESLGE